MKFAGIDYDTRRVDVVLIDLDDPYLHEWRHYPLTGPLLEHEDAFDRARHVRDVLPSRTAWADEGVVLIAIEQPYSTSFRSSAGLSRVQGAILACLPSPHASPHVAVLPLEPNRWKQTLGLKAGGKREQTKAEVRAYALGLGCPQTWPQDACDAFCIARAALHLSDAAARALEAER